MSQSSAKLSPEVAVIVVTYNGEPWIRGCLSSLRDLGPSNQVIVVDNASTDDTCRVVESEFPQAQLIRSTVNIGFGRGNNLGISQALAGGARYIFLLNQDAYVLPTTIGELTSFMAEHTDVGVASPLHCSPHADAVDMKTLRFYIQAYAPDYLSDACMGRAANSYLLHGVNAAAWFVRAEAFEKAGGFDPLFFMYGEDDDLLMRWEHHGISFALLPSCRVVHLRQSPTRPLPTMWQDLAHRVERRRSQLITAIKRPSFNAFHMVAVGLAEGFVKPIGDLLIDRQWRSYVASSLAAFKVFAEFSRIRRHATLTARTGKHFL